MAEIPAQIIDFHVHLFPDKMFNAIWNYFSASYQRDVAHKLYFRECIDYLRKHGVVQIVYSNYAHREGVACGLNDWNRLVLDEYPDLFCFAAYHPGDADALDYAEKILNHPRVLGIKLQLLVQRFFPHDERLFPLYDMLEEKGKRLLFHVGTGPLGNEFVGLKQFQKLLESRPGLQANIAHMGAYEYQGFMDLFDDHPGLYLDTAYAFFNEKQMPGGFNLGGEVLEKYQDRILYGSDFPNLILPRQAELETLISYDFSPQFYRKVFFENAANLIASIVDGQK